MLNHKIIRTLFRNYHYLVLILMSQLSYATPVSTPMLNAQRFNDIRIEHARVSYEQGRARIAHQALPSLSIPKSTGEEVGDYDLTEIIASFSINDFLLPRRGIFSVSLTSRVNGLNQIQVLRSFYAPEQVWIDRNGMLEDLPYRWNDQEWLLTIQIPTLNEGDSLTFKIRSNLDYWFDDPFGQLEEPTLAHHIGIDQLPINIAHPQGDRYRLITEFTVNTPGIFPNAQGRQTLRGNFDHGLGTWRYETETTASILAMTLTDKPFSQYSSLIDISSPAYAYGISDEYFDFLASDIINVYSALITSFPFERFTISTISMNAGVAIGPLGMILMPDDMWLITPQASDEVQWELEFLMAHEIGHQYFPHLVHLQDSAPGWLSEGFAEFMASIHMHQIYQHHYALARNHWTYMYHQVAGTEPSIVSDALYELELQDYFVLMYLKGSCILYQLSRRYENFFEIFRSYVNEHRGRLVNLEDFTSALTEWGQPKFDRLSFSLENYLNRYLYGSERLRVTVDGQYVNDEQSQLVIIPEEFMRDSLEIEIRPSVTTTPVSNRYMTLEEPTILREGYQGVFIDPHREYFLYQDQLLTADIDLNGVVDGLDALEIISKMDLSVLDVPAQVRTHPQQFNRIYDIDADATISNEDVDLFLSQFGSVHLAQE